MTDMRLTAELEAVRKNGCTIVTLTDRRYPPTSVPDPGSTAISCMSTGHFLPGHRG